MSDGLSGSQIAVGVFVNIISAVAIGLAASAMSGLDRAHPHARRAALAVALGIALAGNVVLFYCSGQLFPVFSTVLLFLVFYLFWSQIRQFWNVGLIGADRSPHKGLNYSDSLKMCNNSLSFLGVGARKLTERVPEFEGAMQRCNRPNRPIRFLLCKPGSNQLEKAARGAGEPAGEYRRRVTASLEVIRDLRDRRQWNIEVRFYKLEVPLFRLMFVDDWLCLASHYVFGEGDGSQWPQLHIERSVTDRDVDSLYHPFQRYFDELWEKAEPWDYAEFTEEQ